MNAAPESGKTADYPSEAYPAAINHLIGMKSTYHQALGREPVYTTWKRRGDMEYKHTIDYILISGAFRVVRVLAPPDESDVEPERFPSWKYPSDHVALVAEL